MLDFFRRHQRYFFLMITVVIVISFSFFGTYSTLSNNSFREQVAFKNVNGHDVTRHELNEMMMFVGTDGQDKAYFGGAWGPNFLNDGVIRKDFLDTGLAIQLINAYSDDLRGDLEAKLEKERRYNLYVNPQAKFIGVESAWNNFAPGMSGYYHVLKVAQDPLSSEALQARVKLFILERQFPPNFLRYILKYQEKEHKFITPDRTLDQTDLSLFGYHTTEDWFGPKFVRLVSQFIMNSALIAEQKGYQVSKEEALADLIRNSEASFRQNARNPQLGVTNSAEYFSEQLRRMGMDQNIAAKVWRQVMLFRRMLNDMGDSVFVDPFSLRQVNGYAMESVEGDMYRMPSELRFNNYRSLQKFEVYLDAVTKRSDDDKGNLTTLPTTYLSAAEVGKKTPELVEKRYLLEIAQVDKKSLQSNIGMKEMWNWEVSDKGWDLLQAKFPDVGIAKGANRDERFASLDALDDRTRARIDTFARESIVDEHPEWLSKALEDAPEGRQAVGIHANGGVKAIKGLEKGQDLIVLLDAAPLANEDATTLKPAAKEAAEKLKSYSPNKENYYRIAVIDRAPQAEVMTFADADSQGFLDKLLDSKLEAFYVKVRETSPKDFQRDDKSWKPLADVRDTVADRYFEKVLKGINKSYAAAVPADKAPQNMIGDYAATLRFFAYVNGIKAKIQQDGSQAAQWTRAPKVAASATVGPGTNQNGESQFEGDKLIARATLADQWKLERAPYQTVRSSTDQLLNKEVVFAQSPKTWTEINTPANGDINFFFMESKGTSLSSKALDKSVAQLRDLLSDDAKQGLTAHLLNEMKAKNAISFQQHTADGEN